MLDANQIEVWRDDKKLQATGNVTAVFPQSASSPIGSGFGMPINKRRGRRLQPVRTTGEPSGSRVESKLDGMGDPRAVAHVLG